MESQQSLVHVLADAVQKLDKMQARAARMLYEQQRMEIEALVQETRFLKAEIRELQENCDCQSAEPLLTESK